MENTEHYPSEEERKDQWNEQCARAVCQALSGRSHYGGLRSFIGAHSIYIMDNGVQFQFKMCRKANCVEITVTPADLYEVVFYKLPSLKAILDGAEPKKEVARFECYCDDLQERFEEFTGLVTAMGKVTFG